MAPTQLIIDDVNLAYQTGYISLEERNKLVADLRTGAISAPIWEDYGLNGDIYGRISLQ